MKIILTLLFYFYFITCFAQIPVCELPPSYRDNAYNALKNLDRSQIPTGVLYELVFPLSEIQYFNGQSNTDTTSSSHFIQVWDELYQSTLNNTGKKHFLDLIDDIENLNLNKKYNHPVGIIDYQYNTIDTTAITQQLLSRNNGILYDVPNRPRSPYITHQASLASTLLSEEYPCLYPGVHNLIFKNDYVLSNSGFNLNNVNYLEVKLNNVSIFSQTVNGINSLQVPVTILNTGETQIIEISMLIFGTVKKYYIQNCQYLSELSPYCSGGDFIDLIGYPYSGGYPKGLHSEKGIANFYYAEGNCETRTLKKVAIFVDGFDATNEQHHEGIWTNYLNKEFNDTNGQPAKLGDELRKKGYDVVILDQKKSGRYNSGGGGIMETMA